MTLPFRGNYLAISIKTVLMHYGYFTEIDPQARRVDKM